MNNTLKQRIIDLCLSMNISITELSKRVNMPQTTVNNYLNGSRKISYEFVESLITSFELNANWLITGKGNMYKANSDQATASEPQVEYIKKPNEGYVVISRTELEAMESLISSYKRTNDDLYSIIEDLRKGRIEDKPESKSKAG